MAATTPRILQIYREPLKPGREADYAAIEEESARFSASLGCPHPYLAASTVATRPEVWWFNGYESAAEQTQVADDYARNAVLLEALRRNSERKARLTLPPIEAVAMYRPELSAGPPWILGAGRFLVVTVTSGATAARGTVFETADGVRFIIVPASTRDDADALHAAAGVESDVLEIRPSWSFPSQDWVAADPLLWRRPSTR